MKLAIDSTTRQALRRWIRQRLQTDIRLDAALLARLETTFGTSDPQRLQADPDNSESAAFLCLLFSPDTAIQTTYEAQWGGLRLASTAVDDLVADLLQKPVRAAVTVSGHALPMEMTVPDDALEGFVRRLRIDWQPPAALERILRRLAQEPAHLPTRVRLRHTRMPWHANQVALLDRLLTCIGPAKKDFESLLTFLLSLLPQMTPDADPFTFLMEQRRFFFQCLNKAATFEERLRSGNMEILMLQGARACHGTVDHWRRLMARIDRLAIALFGRSDPLPPYAHWS